MLTCFQTTIPKKLLSNKTNFRDILLEEEYEPPVAGGGGRRRGRAGGQQREREITGDSMGMNSRL